MNSSKSNLTGLLSWAAIAANLLFVLWILVNGINEHFQGTMIERISYISLMALLTLNAVLLLRNRK
jgi:hypothetical protein